KPLALLSAQLNLRAQAAGDWFDVHGRVEVGDFSFPFKALWHHLRRHERLYRLPDGTYFLIPEAWFARYAELAEAAQDGPEEGLRLPKALFTVLQQAGLESATEGADFPEIDPEKIDFQPSPDLKAELRPYQLQGVRWLVGHYRAGFGACLADDMGLGKTLQTIALLLHAKAQRGGQGEAETSSAQLDLFQSYRQELRPLNALIILPASLVFNWQNEIGRFAPTLFTYAHTGPKRLNDPRALAGHDVVLTTYHTARQDLDLLSKVSWHVIVLDESQQIKNRASEVSKVVLSLRADCKISLSGTPIENSLSDLWTQMEFINPATLGSFSAFREQYIVPIEKRDDPVAKQRLFSRVRPFFLRRTKEQVAPELPALSEQLFFSEMTPAQEKLYERTKSAVRNEILALFDDPKTRVLALQALTRLRQIANDPRLIEADYAGGSGKFDDVLAQWDTVRRAGHKVLFFSSFERHLQLFRREFEAAGQSFAWLTGDTATPDRAREVKRFQEDPSVQAFFMTVKAGGVGLNLTAADYVFLLDPWWNPAAEDQAIARAHRIGQTRPVTALRFLSHGTIEEKIRQLQERKKKLGQELFATGEEAPALSREDLELLLV
ncbi:MAG TPA: DEAD/DEAH box helicase, partial [Saprospiraceae bacterium]|nr:DEAD/DEAH box helicase [Saprospiraceae bacterium]